jgi:WS/DGAT/MGAT family acyltransferase
LKSARRWRKLSLRSGCCAPGAIRLPSPDGIAAGGIMPPYAPIHPERFYSVDAAWLHMDSPGKTLITGLSLYDRPLTARDLRAAVEDRLLRFARFRQRVREPDVLLGLPVWEPDPDFDLDAHLKRATLPAPGDMAALFRLVERLMATPLQPRRPLWQMHLVEHFGTGSALIMRLSHAVADGAALVHVLDTFTGVTAKASRAPLPPPELKAPLDEAGDGLAGAILRALDTMDRARALPGQLLDQGLAAASDPVGTTLRAMSGVAALGKVLFIPPDRQTILRGRSGPARRAVVSDPIPLSEIKTISHALGSKVNDVVLSAIAGGFRRYLLEHNQPVSGLNLRATVPVYLGDWDQAEIMRNEFGLVFLSLPVGIEDPLRRLRELKRRMDAIKASPEAAVTYGIMYGMGHTPPAVEHLVAKVFGMKATAVMTNSIGPVQPRYLAGSRIDRLLVWAPHPAGLALSFTILSYAGDLTVSLSTFASVVPDPETILAGFEAEFAELRRLGARRKSRAKPKASA